MSRNRPRVGFVVIALVATFVATLAPARAATDLVAFTAAQALRQGSFDAAGAVCSCGAELCRCAGPDDAAKWPAICAALAAEVGPLAAFGAMGKRFDSLKLAQCNQSAPAASPAPSEAVPAPPVASPAPPPAPPPAPVAATAAASGFEICNGRDDDGDGEVDEGVRMTAWEDRDRDLYGDRSRPRALCPHELAPGWVVNDYDCDDADARRSPARDNCPAPR